MTLVGRARLLSRPGRVLWPFTNTVNRVRDSAAPITTLMFRKDPADPTQLGYLLSGLSVSGAGRAIFGNSTGAWTARYQW